VGGGLLLEGRPPRRPASFRSLELLSSSSRRVVSSQNHPIRMMSHIIDDVSCHCDQDDVSYHCDQDDVSYHGGKDDVSYHFFKKKKTSLTWLCSIHVL